MKKEDGRGKLSTGGWKGIESYDIERHASSSSK